MEENALPLGVTRWVAPEGLAHRLRDVRTGEQDTQAAADGWLGLLRDYREEYLFLTNLAHGPTMTTAAGASTFRLKFRDDVNSLLRMNLETGAVERVALTNHELSITLAGGTGALFKYDTGPFVGIDSL